MLSAVALGDRGAFAELFDLLSPGVYGLATHLTSDSARAQRILHDVFLEAWRHAPRLANTGVSPTQWVHAAARLRCGSPGI